MPTLTVTISPPPTPGATPWFLTTPALLGMMVFFALVSLALLLLRNSPRPSRSQSLLTSQSGIAPGALRGYTLALLDVKRFDEAEEMCAGSLERVPVDPRMRALHGALLALRGEHALALTDLERATQLLRRDAADLPAFQLQFAALTLVAQATELEALGRSAEAAARMREALTIDPNAAQRRANSMRLLAEAARDNELERLAFERLSEWERGRAAARPFGIADPAAAERFFKRALATQPDDARILSDLALAEHANGEHQSADQHFQKALERSPRDPWIHYEYGSLLWRRERLTDARRELALAAQVAPQNAPIRAIYALFLSKEGETAQAEQELLAALNARPDVWITARVFGSVLLAQNKVQQAARAFQEAARLGASDTRFRLEYADALERMGQSAAAEDQYRLAIRADASDGQALARYGAFLFAQLRLDDAEQRLLQSLTWPESERAHITLAGLYLMERRMSDAMRHMQAAQTTSPNDSLTQEYRAEWLLLRGQNDEALTIAQRLADNGVTRSSLYLVLGGALTAQDRTLEAQSAFREAVRYEPGLPATLLRQAQTLRSLGYLHPALETTAQALAVAPNWPDALQLQQDLARELAAPKNARHTAGAAPHQPSPIAPRRDQR